HTASAALRGVACGRGYETTFNQLKFATYPVPSFWSMTSFNLCAPADRVMFFAELSVVYFCQLPVFGAVKLATDLPSISKWNRPPPFRLATRACRPNVPAVGTLRE